MKNEFIMKSITIRILSAIIFVMFFTSCWQDHSQQEIVPRACIVIVNDTERILVLDNDIFGESEIVEIKPELFIHKFALSYTYTKRVDENYCEYYLLNLNEGSYFRIYNTDGELLREWKKGECDVSKKNPYDVKYYNYTYECSLYNLLYSWCFRIDEELLSQEE